MNIAIGVPCGDTLQTATGFSLFVLGGEAARAGHSLSLFQGRCSISAMSRNMIVHHFLQSKCEALLLVDSDMEFPPNSLERLLGHGLDLVGAVYRMRSHPYSFAFSPMNAVAKSERGCILTNYIPSGLMLVRRHVLEAIAYPWFEDEYGTSIDTVSDHGATFCFKVRELGFNVWADMGLSHEVKHHGSVGIGMTGID